MGRIVIRPPSFALFVDSTIEDVPVYDDGCQGVAAAMVYELRSPCCCKLRLTVRADTCCLQTIPIDSGFVKLLHDSLRPCG
ncbi:hypothetical protein TNCV_3005511 [Trichonephila clavipes]|nr:hypothetical protein TNCV_3005511 [Trichonephila clavipes]